MAGLLTQAVTAAITLSTTSEVTCLQIVAPTNQRIKIRRFVASFDGVSGTDNPVRIRILRQSTAGTMSALTLVKRNNDQGETIQCTAQHTATAEPTAGDVLWSQRCHPQGNFAWSFGDNDSDFYVNGGDRVGFALTKGAAPSSCTVILSVDLEE